MAQTCERRFVRIETRSKPPQGLLKAATVLQVCAVVLRYRSGMLQRERGDRANWQSGMCLSGGAEATPLRWIFPGFRRGLKG